MSVVPPKFKGSCAWLGEEAVHSGLTRLGFAIGGRIPQHGSTGDDHWIALPRTLEKDSGSFVG